MWFSNFPNTTRNPEIKSDLFNFSVPEGTDILMEIPDSVNLIINATSGWQITPKKTVMLLVRSI